MIDFYAIECDSTPWYTNDVNTIIQSEVDCAAGSHRVTWNANADGVNGKFRQMRFGVRLCTKPNRYMIIDVSGGASAESFPITYVDNRLVRRKRRVAFAECVGTLRHARQSLGMVSQLAC